MAASEARTVLQRTANRCFVQEDAKRAPKLTSCQSSSSSSSSTKRVEDSGSSLAVLDQQNQSSFMPLHQNPNFPDSLSHNTRLWSHHHHIEVKMPLEAELNSQGISEKKHELGFESFQEFRKLKELSFDPPWNPLSSEKAGPWWRTTDKDELASLVAQRSLNHVENCDLPTPQKVKRSYYGSFDSAVFHDQEPSRTEALSESDLSKTELLEALRHFQTRAREAENMAKEAYAEKEQLVKLLFKQASELFGYKQWLKLLQLEALYFQIKNKKIENNNSKESPVSIPWSNCKPERRRRSKRTKPDTAEYAVGLALGMSLVGAGLLIGWTIGWMQFLSF